MKRCLTVGIFFAGSVLVSAAATAQTTCPAGRAANGACVNPSLADSMTLNAVITSQPKLSYTAYPILPSFDWDLRYPNQLNPNPLPPSSTGTPIPPPI